MNVVQMVINRIRGEAAACRECLRQRKFAQANIHRERKMMAISILADLR